MITPRSNSLETVIGTELVLAAAYRIYVTPVGAVASASSSGSVATVDAGHSFRIGDRALIDPGGLNQITAALTGVSQVALTWTAVTYSITSGMKIVNLGPDTGSLTPNYDGSPMAIYSDADGGVRITPPEITADSIGSYSYWHRGDGRFWELILDSNLTAVKVIPGVGGLPGRLNVQDYGAVGNGTATVIGTNDTARIQAAVDASSRLGVPVYLPNGIYDTTSSIALTFDGTPLPMMAGMYGDGWGQVDESTSEGVTTIRGNAIGSGRGVVEFLGVSNTHAARLKIHDLRIRAIGSGSTPVGTSNAACYCLRIGDAYVPLVERVQLYGAHGLSVKISSSSSYSQILSMFRQVMIWTNWNYGFFASDSLSTNLAVQIETGGAAWDDVIFDSCLFHGQVNTRATVVTFRNCLFSNNTDRASTVYNGAFVGYGSASFRDCYFEDCVYGIQAYGANEKINNLIVDGCYFSPSTNFGSTACIAAILVTDGTYGVKAVSIKDCSFGATSDNFSSGEIVINGSIAGVGPAEYQDTSGLNDCTSSGTYSGSVREIFEIQIDATGTPDTITWRRRNNVAAPTTGVAITGAAQSLADGVSVTFAATTGHTLGTTWLVAAGFCGPENVLIDNCVVNARNTKGALLTKPRVSLGANFLNNYLIRYHTGEVVGRQLYDRSMTVTGDQDTSAVSVGMGTVGIALQNQSGATGGSPVSGAESGITFHGIYQSLRGKFAAIVGRVGSRNATTATEGGFLAFATKDSTATSLSERMRIEEGGDVGIGTTNPVCLLDVNGDVRFGSVDVNVTGNDNVTVADRCLINLTNVSGTNTITLSAPSSQNGTLLILRCVALTAGTMTLADSGNVALSAAWAPDAGDTLTLIAAGVIWYELARSAN